MPLKLGRAFFMAGSQLNAALRAEARWEIEISRQILQRRKKFLLLAFLPVLIPFFLNAALAEGSPSRILFLGGAKAYLPAVMTPAMLYGSLLVGLLAGLITGVIGAGGGYILTPALMSFGVKGIMAVGTDQFHLFAKGIMGTVIHKKLGNVNSRLALWFVLGSFFGVTLGGTVNRAVYQLSPALSDALISGMYVLVLGLLGIYALVDWVRLRGDKAGARSATEATTEFAKWLQALPLKPRVRFDEDMVSGGRRISIYPLLFCGLVVGFVAAIMGVGGGFLTFPMFVYGLGVSTFTTVGTGLLQIIFTTFYSSIFQYAIYGYIFYTVAMGMLLGSLIGVQIGALVTKMVTGAAIRAFYALTILAGFVNRVCALIPKLADMGYLSLPPGVTGLIETGGTILFFLLTGIFGFWILSVFFKNLPAVLRQSRAGAGAYETAAGAPPEDRSRRIVADRRKFALALCSLVLFFAGLALWVIPGADSRSGLDRAENHFNQLAKNSAYQIPAAVRRAMKFQGTAVDFGVSAQRPGANQGIARIVQANGLSARVTGDGRVRIEGDLGLLGRLAAADADLLFKGREAELGRKYDLEGKEAVYLWWAAFEGLTRRYIQENRVAEADFTKYISTRVLEPSYNFSGIQPRDISSSRTSIVLLLGLYVLFTLWYGFSILYLFEGLGIKITKATEKKEA
jgi:uncharacterized protein